jgi:HlyD family secretion protein
MQPQTSGNPIQEVQPHSPVNPPRIVSNEPAPPRRHYWRWLLVLAAIAAGGLWWQTKRNNDAKTAGVSLVRTATATSGNLEQTIRLSGVTGAETFVSIIAPQLRGSRGSYSASSLMGGGGTRQLQASSSATVTVQSNSGGNSSSSSGSSDLMASTGGSGSANASTSRSVKSSTSRVSSGSSGGSSGSKGSSGSPGGATSASSGSDGMGSTASSLPGGSSGGGGGGGSDFMLMLQKVSPAGSLAKKGDVVAEFDRQYMLTRLDDYRAVVASSEAGFKRQRAEMQVSNKAQDQTILAAKGAMEKAALDLKTTPVRGAIDAERLRLAYEDAKARYNQQLNAVPFQNVGDKAQLRAAEIEMQQTKLELKRAETNANRMLTKAPIDGLVVMLNTFRGGEFNPIGEGDQLYPGQMFMQIVDTRSMVLNTTVNQSDVEQMRIGAKATVHFDAYPDLELPARVVAIGAITRPGGLRGDYYKEIPVRLKLEKMDPRVIPDLSISADVIVNTEKQASIVPREAVFTDQVAGAKPFVFVQSMQGWQKREVETGTSSFTHTSILKGLSAGEKIALNRPDTGPAPVDKKE